MDKFTIIRDNREKDGFYFPPSEFCNGTIPGTLKTGDYTIQGMEHLICVERKRSTGEFAANIVQPRFQREIDRIIPFPHKYFIFQFSMDDVNSYPINSGMPEYLHSKVKVKPQFIRKKIYDYQQLGIEVLFCDNKFKAFTTLRDLFKVLYEQLRTSQ